MSPMSILDISLFPVMPHCRKSPSKCLSVFLWDGLYCQRANKLQFFTACRIHLNETRHANEMFFSWQDNTDSYDYYAWTRYIETTHVHVHMYNTSMYSEEENMMQDSRFYSWKSVSQLRKAFKDAGSCSTVTYWMTQRGWLQEFTNTGLK